MSTEKQEFAPQEQPKRNVEVYATAGTCQASFKSSATTLGELKKELDAKGIPHKGMKMVIGENQDELTEDEQALYEKDFTLFLTPIRVRSGFFARLIRFLGFR